MRARSSSRARAQSSTRLGSRFTRPCTRPGRTSRRPCTPTHRLDSPCPVTPRGSSHCRSTRSGSTTATAHTPTRASPSTTTRDLAWPRIWAMVSCSCCATMGCSPSARRFQRRSARCTTQRSPRPCRSPRCPLCRIHTAKQYQDSTSYIFRDWLGVLRTVEARHPDYRS